MENSEAGPRSFSNTRPNNVQYNIYMDYRIRVGEKEEKNKKKKLPISDSALKLPK